MYTGRYIDCQAHSTRRFPDEVYYMIADRFRLSINNASGEARVTMSAMIYPRFMLLNVRACFMIRNNMTISYAECQTSTG